jgi:hypothetical protein
VVAFTIHWEVIEARKVDPNIGARLEWSAIASYAWYWFCLVFGVVHVAAGSLSALVHDFADIQQARVTELQHAKGRHADTLS